jgi:hypothetical protein
LTCLILWGIGFLQKKQKDFPPNTTERTEIHRERIFVSVTFGDFGEIRWIAYPVWFRLVRFMVLLRKRPGPAKIEAFGIRSKKFFEILSNLLD